ncbi:MAG: DUF7557 family protein [Candidatus Nanoarchaeia archaeon]
MATTIQISDKVKQMLDKMKIMERESYSSVIEVLIEDSLELREDVKQELEEARKRIDKGSFVSQEDVEKRFGV